MEIIAFIEDWTVIRKILRHLGGFSQELLDAILPRELHLIIDGNHLYEYVKEDLELSIQKVKPGGFMAGDDYTPCGWWKGGVKQAVDEFSETQAAELVEIRNNSGTAFLAAV